MTAGNLAVFLNFALAMSGYRLPTQESAGPLSPSEAYKAALAPFIETRSQSNDLTDADKFALRIGINRGGLWRSILCGPVRQWPRTVLRK